MLRPISIAAVLPVLLSGCGRTGEGPVAVGESQVCLTHDGGSVEAGSLAALSCGGSPFALTVDATHLYWGDSLAGSVVRAPLDGGTPTTLATGQSGPCGGPFGLAVSATSAYWTAFSKCPASQNGGILAVDAVDLVVEPFDGGPPAPALTVPGQPSNLVVDSTGVYMATGVGQTVLRLELGGGSPVSLESGESAWAIARSGPDVFWSSGGCTLSGTVAGTCQVGIRKTPADGGSPTALVSAQGVDRGVPWGIAADESNVYWTEAQGGRVMEVPSAGGSEIILASGQAYPYGIAVDSSGVYWANEGTEAARYADGTIVRVALDGGTPTTLATGQYRPSIVVVGPGHVYWTNQGISEPDGGGASQVVPGTGGVMSLSLGH